jgi:hypothetical protein
VTKQLGLEETFSAISSHTGVRISRNLGAHSPESCSVEGKRPCHKIWLISSPAIHIGLALIPEATYFSDEKNTTYNSDIIFDCQTYQYQFDA